MDCFVGLDGLVHRADRNHRARFLASPFVRARTFLAPRLPIKKTPLGAVMGLSEFFGHFEDGAVSVRLARVRKAETLIE